MVDLRGLVHHGKVRRIFFSLRGSVEGGRLIFWELFLACNAYSKLVIN